MKKGKLWMKERTESHEGGFSICQPAHPSKTNRNRRPILLDFLGEEEACEVALSCRFAWDNLMEKRTRIQKRGGE